MLNQNMYQDQLSSNSISETRIMKFSIQIPIPLIRLYFSGKQTAQKEN